MKLNKLQAIKGLDSLVGITAIRDIQNKTLLNNIELIFYSTKLCLFSMRIIRGEIEVSNRNEVLVMLNSEIQKLTHLISTDNTLENSEYTHKDTKAFFKKVGLKPKHIEN